MSSESVFKLALLTTAIVAFTIIGALLIRYARRWTDRDGGSGDVPLTLQDLRDLRERGEITQSEFETMRSAIIHSVRGPTKPPASSADDSESRG